MKKMIVRGLPEGLVNMVLRALGERLGPPREHVQPDIDRAAALGRILGWHIAVTGGYAYPTPTRPKRPRKRGKKGKR